MHAPPKELYNMASPWPFSTWGIDVIGEIHPAASNGHRYIMVAIDYFTKWVEAASYSTVSAAATEKFIRNNIITRYGIPHEIITDNGKNFVAQRIEEYLAQYKIKHHRSSPYRPQMNGAVEAANKNLIKILKKTVESRRDWHEKLPYALWAYRTSIRTSTGATPYSLVYGTEAVLPAEVEIPSLRILKEAELTDAEWVEDRIAQLNLIDERRLNAIHHAQCYQKRIARAYSRKVRPRQLKAGDLALKAIHLASTQGKFKPNWQGPFVVKKVLNSGAMILQSMDGEELSEPTNLCYLKKYV
jgi:hypothetical protein